MKTVTIFSNSVGYTSFENITTPSGYNYIDAIQGTDIDGFSLNPQPLLFNKVEGYWLNGLTILHVRNMIRRHLKGARKGSWVILHIGVVECFTHPSPNLLRMGVDYLSGWGEDPWFRTYIVPKMSRAAKVVSEKMPLEYNSFLNPDEFSILLNEVLNTCEGSSVIVMGLAEPNDPDQIRTIGAKEYNNCLQNSAKLYNAYFIDIWNLCKEKVVDGAHLTPSGHSIIYDEIRKIVNG